MTFNAYDVVLTGGAKKRHVALFTRCLADIPGGAICLRMFWNRLVFVYTT